jgi:hypothetical protein
MKKMAIISALLCMICIAANSQNAESKDVTNTRIKEDTPKDEVLVHYGVHVTPKIVNQLFVDDNLIDAMKSYELSMGVDAFYDLSARVQLRSGVNYTAISLREFDYSIAFPGDHDGNGRFDPYKSWYEDKRKGHYIGLPVEVRMKLAGDVNHLYGKVGIETMFRIASSSKSVLVEGGTNEVEIPESLLNDFSAVLFKVNIGIGYEFSIGEGTKMYVEPLLEYGVNKTFVEAEFASAFNNNSHLLNFGLMLGVNF